MAKKRDGSNGRDGITRRDFLDGVAVSAAGLAAAAASPHLTGAEAMIAGHGGTSRPLPPGYYPPTSTGITGQPDDVIRDAIRIDGFPQPDDVHSTRGGPGIFAVNARDVDDDYDLVVVGAGASGLAAAKWYQDRFGPDSRVLLVDSLPDFGGHSHRNEFHIPDASNGGADVMILRNGGTVNLDSIGAWNQPQGGQLDIPGSSGQPAVDMLAFCGVDPDNFPSSSGPGIPSSYGLRQMLLFPKEDWGRDSVVRAKQGSETWQQFLARTPYSPEAQAGIATYMTDETTDWISLKDGPKTDQEKKAILAGISYKRYLMDYVGVNEEATNYVQRTSHGLFAAGIQCTQAGDSWALGQPGFDGLGLNGDIFPGIGRTAQQDSMPDSDPTRAWPDGNTSLLRLLVGKLIPNAIGDVAGARPDQDNILVAKADYTQLDRTTNSVRIRLNSTVADVRPGREKCRRDRHGRWPKEGLATITYVTGTGWKRRAERVRARHVVMACWNRVTARIVDGLPRGQVKNLCYARKAPARLLPGGPQQLAGVRRREDLEREPAGRQPLLGQHDAERRPALRHVLRADAQHARAAGAPDADVHAERPGRAHAARVIRARPRAAAAHELQGLRGRDRRRHRAHGEHPGRQLRAREGHRRDHGQPLELRLRVRAVLDVRPLALRAGRPAAPGAGSQAVQERRDRQQRLGRVRLHPQRDQRGLPSRPGPSRLGRPSAFM